MRQDYYEILGVDELSTEEEITASYEKLKAKYNEDKWLDGEAGTQAALMLGKVETAYREIMAERRENNKASNGANSYDEVAAAIRSGELAKAQELLDAFNERSAEWHYLQSVVFYKKNWMNESKKQLEIAMQMDENNQKYKDAYAKLSARVNYKEETGGAPNINPNPETESEQMGGDASSACSALCYTCLCTSCINFLCCN